VYEALDTLVIQDDEAAISLDMEELFLADQAARQPTAADPQQVREQDALRRVKVLDYVASGQIHAPRNLVHAAFIFQHGDCAEHYRLAHRLAQAALEAGFPDARWIYAATLDRYLMSLGEPQKYGTQYTWIDGEFKLYPVDPATTDAERAEYNVPPLAQSSSPVASSTVQQRRLETWWLTWIGAGFAALSAIIALADARSNAPHGRIVLAIAVLLYLVSVVGHYAQINALNQGTVETQQDFWSVVNGLMTIIWLAFAVVEIFRLIRSP
jgi:hypothetical protein